MTQKLVTITILNEVEATITGLPQHLLNTLNNEYSPFVPGYRYMPLYQLGRWDGRIQYFTKTGSTYVNLLEDIVVKIAEWGYQISLIDNRRKDLPTVEQIDDQIFAHVLHPKTGEPIILRDYQVEMVNILLKNGGGIGDACTGSGKTLMCAAMSMQYGKVDLRTLVIVPDGNLVKQTKADYELVGLDVGEFAGELKELDKKHIIATWQSLIRYPEVMKMFQVVIVDEAHKTSSASIKKLVNEHGKHIPYRFGVTGTIPKSDADKMALKATLGPVLIQIKAIDLINRGILATIEVEVVVLQEDVTERYQNYLKTFKGTSMKKPMTQAEYRKSFLPDFTAEKNYLSKNEQRIQFIADDIMRRRDETGNVLVLVNGIAFGRKLQQLIPGSYLVNGQDVKKVKDRQAIYDKYDERDDVVTIATAHIASTGLSINRIYNMVFIDIGKSFTRVIQSIGRALRKGNGKTEATIVDICSDLKYASVHLAERKQYYKDAQYPFKVIKHNYSKKG